MITFRPAGTLVTGGPYASTLNPMYVSLALLTIAFALFNRHRWRDRQIRRTAQWERRHTIGRASRQLPPSRGSATMTTVWSPVVQPPRAIDS